MKKTIFIILLISLFIQIKSHAQHITINEVQTSNASTIADEDGDFTDWIEIYNSSSEVINLGGYGLSDSSSLPFRWIFPEINLPPGEFLMVYASGKDRKITNHYWETIIDKGDSFKYFIGTEEPPADWEKQDFNDSTWLSGPSGFGYGDNDDQTLTSVVMSVFIRKNFEITDTSQINSVFFHIDFDDAFVAYLNGIPFAWENIEFTGTPPPYNQAALTYTEPLLVFGNPPKEYELKNWKELLNQGQNTISIQVHNHGLSSSDLTLIPFLTLGLNTQPQNPKGLSNFVNLKNVNLHTNFKLSSNGETLTLTLPTGTVSDQLVIPELTTNISYGAVNEELNNYSYFLEPTPGTSNIYAAYNNISGGIYFSFPGGFYNNSFHVDLQAENTDEQIFYTLDGSEPNLKSIKYTSPVNISSTTALRARAIETNKIPGKIYTNTYFINVGRNLPVVSLTTTPSNLFDWNTGIYELGPNAQPENPNWGANFWEDWEKQGNIEIFDKQGNSMLNANTGIKIFGGWTRSLPQKSLAFYARKAYGDGNFNTRLFTDKPIDKFESFVMRNSGNDWMISMFRDGFATGLIKNLNVDRQAFKPAVLYINGQYWGIQNIREKINEHYIEDNYPYLNSDSLDMLQNNASVIHGSAKNYNNLLNMVAKPDFNYDTVKHYIDVYNYTDYQLSQIYFDNRDWPGNNIKFWRPQIEGGKWRWIIYDTDFGFGIWDKYAYTFNTLAFAKLPDSPDSWPNPPWSTFLLRRMLNNTEYKEFFITRFADIINTTFTAESVITHINSFALEYNNEIPFAFNRWERNPADWSFNIDNMRNFGRYRPNYMRNFIQSEFNLPGQIRVGVDVYPQNSGSIKVNTIYPSGYPWAGTYFKQIPVSLIAQAPDGFRFAGWSGYSSSDKDTLILNLNENVELTAHFVQDSTQLPAIIINEINYNSGTEVPAGDWIELFNSTENKINLENWIFKDSEDAHQYIFPENTIIESKAYLVLCRDSFAFIQNYPNVKNRIGNFDFGLSSNGELIRLYSPYGELTDSVPYQITNPWPVLANGDGPTLELIKPWFDNSKGYNWHSESPFGTPGKENSQTSMAIESNLNSEQILSVFPTPSKGKTFFEFILNKPQNVQIYIYNTTGILVDVVTDRFLSSGKYNLLWDIQTSPNSSVCSGIYFYKFISEEFKSGGKIVIHL